MTEDELHALELFDNFLETYDVMENPALQIRISIFDELSKIGYDDKNAKSAILALKIRVENEYSDEYLKAHGAKIATYLDQCCVQIGDSFNCDDNLDIAVTLIEVDL